MDCERALRKDSLSILLYYYNWRMSYTPAVPHNPAVSAPFGRWRWKSSSTYSGRCC